MSECGVCQKMCTAEKDQLMCSGPCQKLFHLSCLPAESVKTRGSVKDWVCESCKNLKRGSSVSSSKSSSATSPNITKEFFIQTLNAFKQEVFKEIRSSKTDFDTFKNSLQFFSEKIDETNKLMEETNKNYVEIRKENENLRQNCATLKKEVNELHIRIRNMEQYSRKSNVEISGIPVTQGEDVLSVVKDVGAAVGVELKSEEVMAAHRVPAYNSSKSSPLIVQFDTRKTRDKWLQGYRKRKTLTAQDVNPSFPRNRVFIGEHLTPENKLLLKNTKEKCKVANYKYVWFREGKIFVRKLDGERCVKIESNEDLVKIK